MVSNINTSSSISLQSPNAIPPRTSSTGYVTPQPLPPAKSVLRPVPESDWLGQNQSRHRKSSSASGHPITGMSATGSQDPGRYATEDLNYTAKRSWSEQKDKVLMGPYDYQFAQPGKDFRTLMVNSFNVWLDVPQESLDVITKVVGMLHTASLLVDDVEDNSVLRRGVPVTHSIFGTAQTINSANYVYFVALQELQKLNNPKAINVYTEELLNLHRGQGMDLFWRDTLTCPTEEEYLEMVGNKTGGLFRLAIKLMQAESQSPIDCVPLVNILGMIYQIQDDYRNLLSPEYGQNKGFCEDLTEGKFSFLIIHSIRMNNTNLQLLNILKQKTSDTEVKRYAVKYMEGTGTFEYTKKVIEVLIARARKMADEIDDGKGKSIGIHKILDKLMV
ncbi:isoprenoid synthase domain-containing protein [Xylariaceae sp. FL0016]|nr:isoprenoid synthase domain-containing protein [Xylariaceae sp. FL0016]